MTCVRPIAHSSIRDADFPKIRDVGATSLFEIRGLAFAGPPRPPPIGRSFALGLVKKARSGQIWTKSVAIWGMSDEAVCHLSHVHDDRREDPGRPMGQAARQKEQLR